MRITVADIYPPSSEQILNDLTIEELTNVMGGNRRRRRSSRSVAVETPITLNIETELETWRTDLNSMIDNLKTGLSAEQVS